MTDPAPPTILQPMIASGVSEDRARHHLAAGTVRVGGEEVTDPDTPAPHGAPWVIGPSG